MGNHVLTMDNFLNSATKASPSEASVLVRDMVVILRRCVHRCDEGVRVDATSKMGETDISAMRSPYLSRTSLATRDAISKRHHGIAVVCAYRRILE
jgi:hypothetical protein